MDLRNIREMLKQCLRTDASANSIARSRSMSHNTVRRARSIVRNANLSPDDIDRMTDTDLRKILYPKRNPTSKVYPDCREESATLAKGYNLIEAHAIYKDKVGENAAVSYSVYCRVMNYYLKNQEIIFRNTHIAGYQMQTDFAGYRPVGLEDGHKRKFELFVAVLPASHYLFANVTRSQSTSDHIEANVAALEFFGGVPDTACSDNLKAVVISRTRRGDPIINQAFLAFADYYGMRVTPARPGYPQDKALVEIGVKLIQRTLRLRLAQKPLLTLPDLNKEVAEVVSAWNNKEMKKRKETRKQRFLTIDQPALKPLPAERLEFIQLPENRRVPADHHISFDRAYYSVPHWLVGKQVSVRGSSRLVEVRFDGQPVALHPRSHTPETRVTNDSHRPESHRAYIERSFSDWKNTLHPLVSALVDAEVGSLSSKDLDRPSLMERVRRLARLYGEKRLISACDRARISDALSIKHVTNMLRNNLDNISLPPVGASSIPQVTPQNNVRGGSYFQRDLGKGDGA